jgi:hypothetical protein
VSERKGLELNGWVMLVVVAMLAGGGWLIISHPRRRHDIHFWIGIVVSGRRRHGQWFGINPPNIAKVVTFFATWARCAATPV